MADVQLDKRVAFDKRREIPDGYGNEEGDWEEQFVVWSQIIPLKGSEPVLAARLAQRQPVVFRIRCSTRSEQITTAWRARYGGKEYNITSVENMDQHREWLDILATAGVAVG